MVHSIDEPSRSNACQLTCVWALVATMPIVLICVQLNRHIPAFLPYVGPHAIEIEVSRVLLLSATMVLGVNQSVNPRLQEAPRRAWKSPTPLTPAYARSPRNNTELRHEQNSSLSLHHLLVNMSRCTSFECLHASHNSMTMHSKPPPFNFPHFLIIGWAKAATSSLFA